MSSAVQPEGPSKQEQLKELKELLDSGVLTREEFDAQKVAIFRPLASHEPALVPSNPRSRVQQPLAGGVENPVEYNVTSCVWAFETCGGTQMILLYPDHAEYKQTVNFCCIGCVIPVCCVSCKTTRPYRKIDQILVDEESCDCCCPKKIMVPGLTDGGLPTPNFRGLPCPFSPCDNTVVAPMVQDLQVRVNAAVMARD